MSISWLLDESLETNTNMTHIRNEFILFVWAGICNHLQLVCFLSRILTIVYLSNVLCLEIAIVELLFDHLRNINRDRLCNMYLDLRMHCLLVLMLSDMCHAQCIRQFLPFLDSSVDRRIFPLICYASYHIRRD